MVIPDPIGDGLRTDAVAYWKMNEASGTRVDATGKGHDLSPINSPTSEIGIGGFQVAKLERANEQYFICSGDDFNNVDGSFTWCIWAKLSSLPTGGVFEARDIVTVSQTGENPSENYSVYKFSHPTNEGPLGIYLANNEGDSAYTDYPPEVDTWYFIVAYVDADASELHIIVNDGPDYYGPITSRPNISNTSLFVGATNPYPPGLVLTPYWDGDIGLVGFWNRLLIHDEIDYLWNGGVGRALFP